MNSFCKFSVSLIATVPILIVLNLIRLLNSEICPDCIMEVGFPFTFYEIGIGRNAWVHCFFGFGVFTDAVCLLLIVAAIAWGWNRVPRLLSGVFALSGAFCAIQAGSGAAVLISRIYWSAGYSIFVTVVSATASVLLFHAARQRWSAPSQRGAVHNW